MFAVSKKLMPNSNARRMNGRASSSGRTQVRQGHLEPAASQVGVAHGCVLLPVPGVVALGMPHATSSLLPALLCCALATPAVANAQDKTLRLPIGDAARKDRQVLVPLDVIVDTSSGQAVLPDELAAGLRDTRLLLIGESHTSIEFHKVQQRVIEALVNAGRHVLIGLEMYPYTEQRSLDHWRDGLVTEEGFVRLSRWYEHWGYHWHYYRDIFLFARDHRIPMYAVNAPRDVVSAVRKKGFQNLTPEEAAHIPADMDVENADHMTFFKASFADDDSLHGGMSEDMWKAMHSAQVTWDATMGFNAVQALKQAADPGAIMVVLVGSGHVAYGLGIERQARKWLDGQITTLVPVPVHGSTDGPGPTVQASYANFVWGIPAESDTLYPTLGLSTTPAEGGRRVIQVEKDSVASRTGFQVNDVIVSMDGQRLDGREILNVLMARKQWADRAQFVVVRDGQELNLTAVFRREPPADALAAPRKPTKPTGS